MRGRLSVGAVTSGFLLLALLAFWLADLRLASTNPWSDLGQFAAGFVWPDFGAVVLRGVVLTVAFAVIGVGFGATVGLVLALVFARSRTVRLLAASMRSIHELFWALLLMQIFGISATTGVLAVGIPYAGIFAKVFAELMEEADFAAERALPPATSVVARFAFARAPILWGGMRSYTLYRLECGLRSSLVLGFIGIPTIGDEISDAFRPGSYHEAAALLLIFYALIATRGLWARTQVLPVLLPASLLALVTLTHPLPGLPIATRLAHFLIAVVPRPLLSHSGGLWSWLWDITAHEIGPGLLATLVLSHLAALLAAVLALVLFPAVSRRFNHRLGRGLGRTVLIVLRGTPEYMLAYVLLQFLGPSMLPAVLALGVHNGGIIAYLMGQHADALDCRRDAPRGVALYAYETMPRLTGQFIALVLYRYEIIVRESAILGMLSIYTIGFYIQAELYDFHLDRAVVLLIATGALSVAVDATSRALRRRLRIERLPTGLARSESAYGAYRAGAPEVAHRAA